MHCSFARHCLLAGMIRILIERCKSQAPCNRGGYRGGLGLARRLQPLHHLLRHLWHVGRPPRWWRGTPALFYLFLTTTIMHQVVTSSTMARTKEGGELKAAKLPNWLVLEQLDPDPGGKNPGSGASILSPLIYIFIAAYLLLINDAICPGSDVLRLI